MARIAGSSDRQPHNFSRHVLAALDEAKIIGLRAGAEHRFTGVWVVVARHRVFVRSWNDGAQGWHQAFFKEPRGALRLDARQIPVRARKVSSERLLEAIDRAYREKYDTKANLKWVRGFHLARRRMTTTELVPC